MTIIINIILSILLMISIAVVIVTAEFLLDKLFNKIDVHKEIKKNGNN